MKQFVFWMLVAAGWASGVIAAPEKPNVVLIYTDDQAISQFGCYGGQETPHIDRLAEGGLRLDRFYVGTALCAPSRYGLQTGRFASSAPASLRESPAGEPLLLTQSLGDEENRPPEKWALPTTLREAGYTTGFVGKYHLGFMGERIKPLKFKNAAVDDPGLLAEVRHNFDLAQQGCYAGGYDYAEALYHDNPQPDNFYRFMMFHNQDWVTWKALEFIEQNRDEPFFLIMNTTLVHWPPEQDSLNADRSITPVGRVDIPEVQPSRENVLARAAEVSGDNIGWYGKGHKAGVIWLDDAIGAVMGELEKLGMAEKTLVLVLSDHGRDAKWTVREGGIRSGGVVYWPGVIEPEGVSDGLVQNVDIAPTLFEICGVEPSEEFEMHGISVADHLLTGAPSPRKFAFGEIGYQRAVVSDDGWKYMALRMPEEQMQEARAGTEFDRQGRKITDNKQQAEALDQLYNLNAEMDASKPLAERIKASERNMTNLANDPAYAEQLARMKALMTEISDQLPHSFGEFTQ